MNATAMSSTEIRRAMLKYFYDRNSQARGKFGKRGAYVKISSLRRDMKELHGLTAREVIANLTYLVSEGWVDEKPVTKAVTTPRGVVIPSETRYYVITARGIDKIEGPGEFSAAKLDGIRIEATGRNIITIGDGNQVDAQFHYAAERLSHLREGIKRSNSISEEAKVECVSDIDSIQSQLAKTRPDHTILFRLWAAAEKVAVVAGLADLAQQIRASLPL